MFVEIGFKTGEGSAILDRHGLSDEQWELIEPLLPGKVGDRGRSGADNRKFVEAVLWIANTGAVWRDLPASFGNWNSNFRRFRRWAIKGVFDVLFERLSSARVIPNSPSRRGRNLNAKMPGHQTTSIGVYGVTTSSGSVKTAEPN